MQNQEFSRGTVRLNGWACVLLGVVAVIGWSAGAWAQAPPGYYDTVDDTNSTTMRATLHDVIDDHVRFPYSHTTNDDTWVILELADEDPGNASNILDVYKNESIAKFGGGVGPYEREHTWPSSYGFPTDNTQNYPYTDCHMLHLVVGSYNGSRSNKPYRYCNSGCSENPTDVNNGQGGGSGTYPGNSNWTEGSFTQGTWETWIGKRGDVARALLYMDMRYEGGTHGGTGASEPDLILTDNEALIDASNTGSNEPVAYMGMLSALLAWHVEDPVDQDELARNDVVFSFQQNRNPFIDHPEWADCVFLNICGCNVPADCDDGLWCNGAEDCVGGSCVAGSDPCPGQNCDEGTQVCEDCFNDPQCDDGLFCNGAETCVANVCVAGSDPCAPDPCNEGPDTCGSGSSGEPWINEIHYDNDQTDVGEFVEIAGPAGLDLANWTVQGYNGSTGATYSTSASLSGVIPDQGGCMGVLDFNFIPMQNGSPDGLALIDPSNVVVEFISYEGSFTATEGAANGMTSVDIGVFEPTNSPATDSLQLSGTGSMSSDFTWQSPALNTRGLPNTGQTFDDCGGGCTSDPECDDGLFCNGAETCDIPSGNCQAGSAVNCDDSVGCTDDSCNEATDSCDNVANDGNCDNVLFCDGAETCDPVLDCQGGSAVDCDDGVGCTDDSCNEATDSCDNAANDGNCDNGLFCDGAETCDPVLDCQGGSAVNCADGVGCTDDSCNEGTDSCDNAANDGNCDNGLFCDGAESCDPVLDCQLGTDPCPGMVCDEVGDQCVGCLGDPDCDDGVFCNGAETCAAGTCQSGSAVNCDDGVGCTDDSCNEGTDSCDNAANNANCDNGLFCDGAETCDALLDCQAGTAPNCDDAVGCTDDSCNETTDSCDNVANNANCDNGLFCDGAETCDPVLDCQGGSAVNCDDGVGCTDDSCNEGTDSCDNAANNANCPDDGLFCNGTESCDALSDCVSSGDPCAGGTTCNEATDTCDASGCDNDGTCEAGEDCNNCPNDCFSGSGAVCNNGICEAGDGEDCVICPEDCNGVQSGKPSNRFCCGDGDGQNPLACSDSACSTGGWVCTDVPASASCCGDGTCEGSEDIPNCAVDCAECTVPSDCDDADSCTIDDCVSSSCSNTPIDCDDADACTADSCSGGACFNDPISCDDGDSCTTDTCNSVTGCENTFPVCGPADGCCGPSCDPANDPDCFVCGDPGAACSVNADCCSNNCKGNGTCK